MTTPPAPNGPPPFAEWAKGARGTARVCEGKGDSYGVELALARAEIYTAAAEIVAHDPDGAPGLFLKNALACQVRTPPLIDYDPAGLDYIRARAWQFCARHLDPNLPEVQPKWP